jgi:predicted GTPase
MPHGAGFIAASSAGASIVDPRPSAVGSLREVYAQYPHIGPVLPAVGYSAAQLHELEETIRAAAADVVVAATPVDLARLVAVPRPIVRVRYEFAEAGERTLGALVDDWVAARAAP